MKNRKFVKPLLIVVAMILVCVLSVFATIAYLTDTSNIATNTFTVGDVEITLDEAKVDEYGVKDGTNRVAAGNEYKLLPNHTYAKDPTVTVVEGSEVAYVRMFVEISDITNVKAAFPAYCVGDENAKQFLPQYLVNGWDDAAWLTTNKIVEADNKAYYEFRYYTSVDAREAAVTLDALFDEIKIPADINNDTLGTLDDMEIKVVAQAVQADGFLTVDAAFAALDVDGLDAAELAAFFAA